MAASGDTKKVGEGLKGPADAQRVQKDTPVERTMETDRARNTRQEVDRDRADREAREGVRARDSENERERTERLRQERVDRLENENEKERAERLKDTKAVTPEHAEFLLVVEELRRKVTELQLRAEDAVRWQNDLDRLVTLTETPAEVRK